MPLATTATHTVRPFRTCRRHAAAHAAFSCVFLLEFVGLASQVKYTSAGYVETTQSLEEVAQRMRYWRSDPPGDALAETAVAGESRKYLLLEQDGAGVNNKRIGWEMAGLVALHTGRTLVLPPNEAWWAVDRDGTTTKTEDFISLEQLRGGLPVLTFNEFARKEQQALELPAWTVHEDLNGHERAEWKDFSLTHFQRPGTTQAEWCDLDSYRSEEAVIYANHYPEGRLLNCEQWWDLGKPEFTEAGKPWAMPNAAYSLLRNHFVWHEDVFRLAAPIVQKLGLFRYVALHARFNDFAQFSPSSVQSAQGIMDKWATAGGAAEHALLQQSHRVRRERRLSVLQLSSRSRARAQLVLSRIMHWVTPGTTIYISTDETDESFLRSFKDRGINAYWSHDFFDQADSPISELVRQDPIRAEKLRGPVEQVVCAFGRIFLGTAKSTFSGYITRMRIYADAPQSGLSAETRLFHTRRPTPEITKAVEQEIAEWEARGGATALDRSLPGRF